MIGATILSVTLVPVLCSLLVGGRVRGEEHNPVMRSLVWLYRPVLDFALRHRVATLAVAVLVVAGAAALVPRIGTEFMPPLNEGDLMFMPVTDPAIGLGQAIEITRKQNAAIQKFPEVASVVAKIARADTSTDPAPVNMTETIVSLKPEREWRPGMTREKLIGELDQATTLPGVSNIWTQPISNRINMLTIGIRSEVGVKVSGNDRNALQERARAMADVLAGEAPEHRATPERRARATVATRTERLSLGPSGVPGSDAFAAINALLVPGGSSTSDRLTRRLTRRPVRRPHDGGRDRRRGYCLSLTSMPLAASVSLTPVPVPVSCMTTPC
jgi:Cu/Ag efflux pump CusA